MVKRIKSIEWKEVEGETILLNHKKNEFFVLNETGTIVWKKLNGKNSEEMISKELAKKFKVTEKKALADTKQLIKKLVSINLARN